MAYCSARVTSKHDRKFVKLLLSYQESWMSSFPHIHLILQPSHKCSCLVLLELWRLKILETRIVTSVILLTEILL